MKTLALFIIVACFAGCAPHNSGFYQTRCPSADSRPAYWYRDSKDGPKVPHDRPRVSRKVLDSKESPFVPYFPKNGTASQKLPVSETPFTDEIECAEVSVPEVRGNVDAVSAGEVRSCVLAYYASTPRSEDRDPANGVAFKFAQVISAREIHLYCVTDSDQGEIYAVMERRGVEWLYIRTEIITDVSYVPPPTRD